MSDSIYDVTIVGGGPVGMFASFYAGMHELKTQLIEALPQLGGQITALYPEKQIWDVAGKPGVLGQELITDLKKQMSIVKVDQKLGTKVTNVVKDADDWFTITTTQGISRSKTVVIALGNGAFTPRKLALNGVDELSVGKVNYFVKHKDDYANQRVAVLGGGNSAMDMALMLESVADKVYLIHRREEFRGLALTRSQLQASTVQLMTPYLPRTIEEQDNGSITMNLKKMRSDSEATLNVDKVLVNYGFTSNNAALTDWQLDLATDRHQIKVDSKMQTNIPGVYAIGDDNIYPGKTPLIATGFGEAPIAITDLAKKLYPHKRMATHSSSMHFDSK
ncbi:MAG: NAD(P)/FAD-dependent oxidoreductase [Limosilactobacillus coleohominis]|uniref:NAD(P)/FAD-dependent oxidoreductase n=1 Tax=Limosilactobacillus coleohominis TaxID=181675 RepID=UPI002A83F866|nr:NAD(P)/FAD-dependent oxidoreductase [Limosilactobacillus coleohominis]MCI5812483.1 NAD(P)/FAD-dependent oxidoreductase [Lactobacillus sp.]MDY3702397.1 NAD(P)/FAD-dependent oxidoreductase [Limosilactobacillus coleohominis]MDY5628633.1 NAD(P)/FAD-dependent oxidoreductase [Limosilactobacillus coleohominis]